MILRIAKERNKASSVHKEAVWLLFLTVRVVFSRGTVAEPRASVFGSKVDAVFLALDKKGSPDCTLAVVRQGKVIYERGYGMANLDYNLPITPKSNFYIASTLRQSTVFSLALLARQGKLSLDEAITEYFPVPAAVYGSVTVRQLIYHTSGVQDYFTLSDISVTVKGGVRPLDKINTVSPSSQELSTYAGECYRDELDVTCRFYMRARI